MDIIKHLASRLAELINISAPAARGLIKLAIKDEIGPFRPLNQVSFNEFKSTIENSLKKRLINLEIATHELIVQYLVRELTEYQSLITLGGV
ncbi:MAG: hypothetical protein EAX91_02000 [Candidatus Lokiarchaeota archaeon]|nr:hypothetical protein [Candidatus Lokiarchaeota archaeon]